MSVNKKIFAGVLSLLMVSPTPVFATNNPLEESQNATQQAMQDRFENEDNSNEAKNQQPFDIQSEAYSIYGSAKADFQKLQSQYGSLNETNNASTGFKAYLKSVQEDKDNQALQNEINKVAAANYTVKTTDNTLNDLAQAVEGISDEEKAESLKQQEKAEQEEKDNTIIEESEENVTFSDAFGDESLAINDKYNQTKDKQTQKTEESKEDNIKSFGDAYNQSQDNNEKNQQQTQDKASANKNKTDKTNQSLNSQYNQAVNEANKNISNSENTNKAFGNAAAGQNTSIQKNYSALRKQIISAQKTISSTTSKASASKSYQSKVNSIINKIK